MRRFFPLMLCALAGLSVITAGCAGENGTSDGTCNATIGSNQLPITGAATQVIEFLASGQVRDVSGVVLRSLPVSATAGLPPQPSASVQEAVAKVQAALKDELAQTPASSVSEAWRSDGRAVIARLMPGDYLVTLTGQTVRKVEIEGSGCWNFSDVQFDAHGRAVARALLAPGD